MKVLQAKTVLTAPWACKELSAKGLELKAPSTTCAACTMLHLIFTCGISWHDTPKFIRACIVAESQQRSRRLSYRVGISVCGDNKPRPISTYSNISSENLLSTHISPWTDWGQKRDLTRWECAGSWSPGTCNRGEHSSYTQEGSKL